MNKLNFLRSFALALACAALSLTTVPAEAGVIKAHAGTTFTLTPVEFDPVNGMPTKFTHTVDGVVRVTGLGNCTVHFDVIRVPISATSFSPTGTMQLVSADGSTTLNAEVKGTTSTVLDNPFMGNLHYEVEFTGGTGLMAHARGKAEIDGFGLFAEDFASGKATWVMLGTVSTHGRRHDD